MPSTISLKNGLALIGTLVDKFIAPKDFYSDLNASKNALIDLAALGILQLNFTSQLEQAQYIAVSEKVISRSREILSLSYLDRLNICYAALSSLLKSEVMNDYAVEKKYFLLSLANILEKLMPDGENKLKTSVRLQQNIEDLVTQTVFIKIANDFFKYLKNLNEEKLQAEGLTGLLSKVDSSKGISCSVAEPVKVLVKRIQSLLEELSLYIAEEVNSESTNNENKSKKDILAKIFEQIKLINGINRNSKFSALSFDSADRHKINTLLREYIDKYPEADGKSSNNFETIEETPISIKESAERSGLNAFRHLFDMDLWSTQAKGLFGKTTPQGIKELRELWADETLSMEEKIIKARVIVSQRLTNPIANRSLVVHQCYIELNKRIFERFFYEVYSSASNPSVVGTSEYEKIGNIINSQSEAMIAAITVMQQEIEETALSLENTIQKIPVDGVKDLLSKMSSFLQKQETETTGEISKLKVLLRRVSTKTTVNGEDHLEALKSFISAYIFLKNKIALASNKPIKNKEDLFCQDLFATLDLVAEGFRKSGYQALLDKIHCHRDLSGQKLFSALRNAENDKVMASPHVVSFQNPYPHSSAIKSAVTEAVAKLENIVPVHQQWLGPDLVNTPLGKILSSLREQVQQISRLSYFTPTGIKKLDNAFKIFDAEPLQQGEKQRVISLLQDIRKTTTERLQGYNRHPLLHLFYRNTDILFAELMKPQTVATDKVSYEEMQAKAQRLLAKDCKFITDKGEFSYTRNGKSIENNFLSMLKQFMQEINDRKWNKKGVGFAHLYKKLPDGIAQLQKIFQTSTFDFSQKEIMELSSAQKIDLIKVLLQVRALLMKKVLSNSSRDKEVGKFYETSYQAFKGQFQTLKDTNKELYSIFLAIDYADVLPSTESILSYLRVPGRVDNALAAIKPARNLLPVEAELSAESTDAPSISVSFQLPKSPSVNRYSFHSACSSRASLSPLASGSGYETSTEEQTGNRSFSRA